MIHRDWTDEQLRMAVANVGVDIECGSCAATFYTGFGGYAHDPNCRSQSAPRTPHPLPHASKEKP